MMNIFERLGVKPDATAEEIVQRISEKERECRGYCEECSLQFEVKDEPDITTSLCLCSCAEGWAIILKEIEQRGARAMWEQMRRECFHLAGEGSLCCAPCQTCEHAREGCAKQCELFPLCTYDTCALLKKGGE
ncbi:MAG: hypothetical protein ACYDCO_01845 [Armatimonadota bacterium]